MSNFQDLKKFRGQPWSAWTDYIGYRVPPELCEEHVDNHKGNKESQTMLLSRNDIPIFGHCPTAEVFELAVCNYCGDKFKIPALLEHIRNRHQDGQVLTINQDTASDNTIKSNNDESPRSKSSRKSATSRHATKKLHKEKLKNRIVSGKPSVSTSVTTPILANGKCSDLSSPPPSPVQQPAQMLQVQVQLDRTKIGCNEKVAVISNKEGQRNDVTTNQIPPNSPAKVDDQKLKHIRVKLKKKQEDKVRQNIPTKEFSKEGNTLPVTTTNTNKTLPIRIAQSQCLPELTTRLNSSNEQITGTQVGHINSGANAYNKLKERPKDNEHSQRKASSRQAATNSSFNDISSDHSKQEKSFTNATNEINHYSQRKVNTQVSTSKEDRKRSQSQKTTERRVSTTGTVRDRTYNPDKHCGVLTKENTKPCTRSLTCKTHSINLRRAVKGRSKNFDVLLADHRIDKELARTSNIELNNSTTNFISPIQLKKSISTAPVETKVDFHEDEIKKASLTSSINNSNAKITNSFGGDTLTAMLEPFPQLLSLPVSIKPQNFESQSTAVSELKQLPLAASVTDPPTLNSVSCSTSISSSTLPSTLVNNQIKSNNLVNITQNIDIAKTSEKQSERNCRFDGYQQWHPLWRRNRGLLYTSMLQTPRLPPAAPSINDVSWNSIPPDNIQQAPPPCLLQAVEQCTKALLAASTNTSRSSVNAPLPSSTPTVTSPPLYPLDDTTPIPKRTSSPTNADTYVVLKKMKTQNGQISVWGPLNTAESLQSSQGRSVVQLSINSIIGKNIMPASSIQSHQIVSNIPGSTRTIKLLPTPVSIGASRIHYISASGPIPLALQQVAIVPQVM